MTEVTVADYIPIYCEPCNESHRYPIAEIKLLLWILQAESQGGGETDVALTCFDIWLREGQDPEMYAEHLEAMQARDLRTSFGIDCPDHFGWRGPWHVKECPWWAEEEE